MYLIYIYVCIFISTYAGTLKGRFSSVFRRLTCDLNICHHRGYGKVTHAQPFSVPERFQRKSDFVFKFSINCAKLSPSFTDKVSTYFRVPLLPALPVNYSKNNVIRSGSGPREFDKYIEKSLAKPLDWFETEYYKFPIKSSSPPLRVGIDILSIDFFIIMFIDLFLSF